jgi:hypothetical protein
VSTSARRPLGYGLLAGAAGISILMAAWLATSGAQGGGIVLGLLLLFVLAGPLAGAGWYVLARARADVGDERAFVGKRRILERDRLFRAQLAPQLRQLATVHGVPAEQLNGMAHRLEQTDQDEAAWYDTIQLDDAQAAVLTQYDDLVLERVRWLRDHTGVDASTRAAAVADLQQALDQRSDLLVRGHQAPSVAPAQLLRAPEPAQNTSAIQGLAIGDAVSHGGVDYLVEGVATAFSDGQTWTLVHLVPAAAGPTDRWLYVSPGGLELAILDESAAPRPGANQIGLDGTNVPLEATRSATVRIASKAGAADGVLVSTWSYRAGQTIGLVEQWPDGAVHAYGGRVLKATDVEVWPAARSTTATGSRTLDAL